MLGRPLIESRTLSDLTPKEKRLIKLEENTKRKALMEFEALKILADLAEVASEISKEEFRVQRTQNPSPTGGRPKEPGSLRAGIEHGVVVFLGSGTQRSGRSTRMLMHTIAWYFIL